MDKLAIGICFREKDLLRFFIRVEMPENIDECWIWKGCVSTSGYGRFSAPVTRESLYAHRVAYEAFVGPISEGKELDHLCGIKVCVNPFHLEAVSRKEHNRRGNNMSARRNRQTHCIHGHELRGSNLYIRKSGWRCCMACMLRRNRKWKRRNRYGVFSMSPSIS